MNTYEKESLQKQICLFDIPDAKKHFDLPRVFFSMNSQCPIQVFEKTNNILFHNLKKMKLNLPTDLDNVNDVLGVINSPIQAPSGNASVIPQLPWLKLLPFLIMLPMLLWLSMKLLPTMLPTMLLLLHTMLQLLQHATICLLLRILLPLLLTTYWHLLSML